LKAKIVQLKLMLEIYGDGRDEEMEYKKLKKLAKQHSNHADFQKKEAQTHRNFMNNVGKNKPLSLFEWERKDQNIM
jgi:hypothetical protein